MFTDSYDSFCMSDRVSILPPKFGYEISFRCPLTYILFSLLLPNKTHIAFVCE